MAGLLDFLQNNIERPVGNVLNGMVANGRAGAQSARMPSNQQNVQRFVQNKVVQPFQQNQQNFQNARRQALGFNNTPQVNMQHLQNAVGQIPNFAAQTGLGLAQGSAAITDPIAKYGQIGLNAVTNAGLKPFGMQLKNTKPAQLSPIINQGNNLVSNTTQDKAIRSGGIAAPGVMTLGAGAGAGGEAVSAGAKALGVTGDALNYLTRAGRVAGLVGAQQAMYKDPSGKSNTKLFKDQNTNNAINKGLDFASSRLGSGLITGGLGAIFEGYGAFKDSLASQAALEDATKMTEGARQILGVTENSTPQEIKQAYTDLAKQFHPDVTGGSPEAMSRINLANDIVTGKFDGNPTALSKAISNLEAMGGSSPVQTNTVPLQITENSGQAPVGTSLTTTPPPTPTTPVVPESVGASMVSPSVDNIPVKGGQNIYGKDGSAWLDYNSRYQDPPGSSLYNARSQAEFNGLSDVTSPYFKDSADAKMLQDVVDGNKKLYWPENGGLNVEMADLAKKNGLAVVWDGGTPYISKDKNVITSYLKEKPNGGQQLYDYIGYKPSGVKGGVDKPLYTPLTKSNGVTQKSDAVASSLGLSKSDLNLAAKKEAFVKNGGDINAFGKPVSAEQQAIADKAVQATGNDTIKLVGKDKPVKTESPLSFKSINGSPTKIAVPDVQPGDYQTAINNAVTVESVIRARTQSTVNAMRNLSKEEKANFWYSVEDPTISRSPQMEEAIARWRNLADTVHGTGNQELGGITPYTLNYARHVLDVSTEAKATKIADAINSNGGSVLPGDFKGLDRQKRLFDTRKAGESAGVVYTKDPVKDIIDYGEGSASALKKQTLIKSIVQADAGEAVKNRSFDLHNGKVIQVSQKGLDELKGFTHESPSSNPLIKGYRAVNRNAKAVTLGLSQFHPVNIGVLRVAPTMISEGHPIQAIKAVGGMFRAALDKSYADRVLKRALDDGIVEKSARIGMPYGSSDFRSEGVTTLHRALGENMVFGREMPSLQDGFTRSILGDLEKKGIGLGSTDAQATGTAGNHLMGYVNREVQNIDPKVMRGISDVFLSGQFTPAKAMLFKDAAQGGYAGSLGRRALAANILATAAIATGVGYLLKQKSDDIRDILLRALIDPAIPTPFKDDEGNTIQLRMPGTNTSDIAKLIGVKLVRGQDGHLGVEWQPGNLIASDGPTMDYFRSRLAIVPSDAVKISTNTDYSGKSLYSTLDSVSNQDKAIQVATTLLKGDLPIPLQGAPYLPIIKDHLPQASQDILTNTQGGVNPMLKSGLSSIGVTPTTDKTVGKGLSTTRYYDALDTAKQGLNNQEADVLDAYSGSKKDPVSGKYVVQPSVWDSTTKARSLLQNPGVIDKLITMNKGLNSQGEKVDPMWLLSKDQLVKTLQYQAMDTGPQKTNWYADNKQWYQPVADNRNKFFSSLPPSDPNKLAQPIEYPQPTPQVQSVMDKYYSMTDPTQKAQFMKVNPQLQDQMDKQVKYANDVLVAKGQAAQKTYPVATPQVQSFTDNYLAADKATRASLRNTNPQMYQNMISYFDSTDLYGIGNQAAQSQLQGNPDTTSKELKQMSSLSQDIYQNTDGTYLVVPAGWMQGLTNSSSGYGYGGGKKNFGAASRLKIKSGKVSTKLPKVKTIKLTVQGGIKSGNTGIPTTLKLAKAKLPRLTANTNKRSKLYS